MPIEHRPLLNLFQKWLTIFSYILKAKYLFEIDAASVKKGLLFFQSKESLQETTSFKLSD